MSASWRWSRGGGLVVRPRPRLRVPTGGRLPALTPSRTAHEAVVEQVRKRERSCPAWLARGRTRSGSGAGRAGPRARSRRKLRRDLGVARDAGRLELVQRGGRTPASAPGAHQSNDAGLAMPGISGSAFCGGRSGRGPGLGERREVLFRGVIETRSLAGGWGWASPLAPGVVNIVEGSAAAGACAGSARTFGTGRPGRRGLGRGALPGDNVRLAVSLHGLGRSHP
jgi:hypothetical protein